MKFLYSPVIPLLTVTVFTVGGFVRWAAEEAIAFGIGFLIGFWIG